MKTLKLVLILLFFAGTICAQSTDDVVIAKRIKINSTVLGEERMAYVSLPFGYSKSKDSFPVLYLLNGDALTVNYASGLVNSLSAYGLCPPMIVVAIESPERNLDMMPTKPKFGKDGKAINYQSWDKVGEADKFLSFVETELFPFINKSYRALPYRIVAGHSAGGVCVTHALLSHSSMFNAYIALSPSLYWDSGLLNRTAQEKIAGMNLKYKQYYFTVGGNEPPSTVADAHTFAQTLRVFAPTDLRWKFDYLADEDHGSQATVALLYGLRFIYQGWSADGDQLVAGGVAAINSFYKSLSDRFGYAINPDAETLNSIGWGVLRTGRHQEAIKIFEQCATKFPDYPEAYSHLGEGYAAAGNTEQAIKAYEKAIELATTLNDGSAARYKMRLENLKRVKSEL